MSRADGRVKRRAAAGSPAPWCTCQNADMERDGGGGAIADRPPDAEYGNPQAHHWMRPNDRPMSQWSFSFPIEAD